MIRKDLIDCLDQSISHIEQINPTASIDKGYVTIEDMIKGQMNIDRNYLDKKIQEVRDYVHENIFEATEKILKEQNIILRKTAAGRQFFKIYEKYTMAITRQITEYLLSSINILSSKTKDFVLIENNKIYVTIPIPDIKLPGMSTSLIDTLQETDIEGIWYKIKAFFNKKQSKRGFFDIEAEVVLPYVRQFDGKWIKIENGDEFDIENYIETELENGELLNIEKYENHFIITASILRAQNLEFGIFGVPDSEVYSDNLDYHQNIVLTKKIEDLSVSSELIPFIESSRECHDVIDPSPYSKMNSTDLCVTARAYQRRCDSAGASIMLPSKCY